MSEIAHLLDFNPDLFKERTFLYALRNVFHHVILRHKRRDYPDETYLDVLPSYYEQFIMRWLKSRLPIICGDLTFHKLRLQEYMSTETHQFQERNFGIPLHDIRIIYKLPIELVDPNNYRYPSYAPFDKKIVEGLEFFLSKIITVLRTIADVEFTPIDHPVVNIMASKGYVPIRYRLHISLKKDAYPLNIYVPKPEPKPEEKVFIINKYLQLKLIKGNTRIYVKGAQFLQCKYLLLNIPKTETHKTFEINSIDDAQPKYSRDHEANHHAYNITPEQEFQGHCSNLQVWAENNYDTRLLHRNIAFRLLKKLSEAGDPKAKKVFQEEIAKRIIEGNLTVFRYLSEEGYFQYLTDLQLEVIFNELNLHHFITYIKRFHHEERYTRLSLIYTLLRRLFRKLFERDSSFRHRLTLSLIRADIEIIPYFLYHASHPFLIIPQMPQFLLEADLSSLATRVLLRLFIQAVDFYSSTNDHTTLLRKLASDFLTKYSPYDEINIESIISSENPSKYLGYFTLSQIRTLVKIYTNSKHCKYFYLKSLLSYIRMRMGEPDQPLLRKSKTFLLQQLKQLLEKEEKLHTKKITEWI